MMNFYLSWCLKCSPHCLYFSSGMLTAGEQTTLPSTLQHSQARPYRKVSVPWQQSSGTILSATSALTPQGKVQNDILGTKSRRGEALQACQLLGVESSPLFTLSLHYLKTFTPFFRLSLSFLSSGSICIHHSVLSIETHWLIRSLIYSFLLQLFIKHIFPQAQRYRVNIAQFSQKSRQDQNSVLKMNAMSLKPTMVHA